MWTETCYYNFPSAAEIPSSPASAALDMIGQTASGYLVNVRWWAEDAAAEPATWTAFRQPAPQFPKRVFA
jgi:hypothetical protein